MDTLETDPVRLRDRLAKLRQEHQDLNDVIDRLVDQPQVDQLQIRRLKKRKLVLKDEIQRVEDVLVPDIIA